MLRKKLKLSDQPEPEPTTAGFDYAPMEFALRPQSLLPITSPHFEPKPQFAPQPQYQPELPAIPSAVPLYYLPPVVPALPLWHRIYQLELQLCEALKQIPLPAEVAATYDPIQYAAELHLAYMQRFLDRPKAVLFLGMNPGPWGMCQTGVRKWNLGKVEH